MSADGAVPKSGVRSVHVMVPCLCALVNLLEGYDLLAIAFTLPHISAEWGVSPASLGIVVGIGIAGVALGALLLAPIADRWGRRPTILLCLAMVSVGMLGVPLATDVWQLAALRLLTGLGVGMAQPSVNTLVAEYAHPSWRGFAVSVYATGYPLGSAVSGSIALALMGEFGWTSVYLVGGLGSILLLPLAWFLLPESRAFLLTRQPPSALERLNAIGRKTGDDPIAALPPRPSAAQQPTTLTVFRPSLLAATLLTSFSFLAVFFTVIFIFNWVPTILLGFGLSSDEATSGGIVLTVSGIVGSLLFGAISLRVPVIRLSIAFVLIMFAGVLIFGFAGSAVALMLSCAVMGFCANGAMVGLLTIAARAFPSEVRATGTGVAVAAGRLGGVLSVTIGGALIGLGYAKSLYVPLLALPLLVSAFAILALRRRLLSD